MLHTLHCLDHLRKTLYPEGYPQDPENAQTHSAHCLDHLRQLAMCHSDLTPIPTQYFPGISQNYINSSREHTCRDFWAVRDWATERFNGTTAVKPRNRDGMLVHFAQCVQQLTCDQGLQETISTLPGDDLSWGYIYVSLPLAIGVCRSITWQSNTSMQCRLEWVRLLFVKGFIQVWLVVCDPTNIRAPQLLPASKPSRQSFLVPSTSS